MIIHVPPRMGFTLAKLIEPVVSDVLITRDEIAGLVEGLLVSEQSPTGKTHLEDWLRAHRLSVGKACASELQRHYR